MSRNEILKLRNKITLLPFNKFSYSLVIEKLRDSDRKVVKLSLKVCVAV